VKMNQNNFSQNLDLIEHKLHMNNQVIKADSGDPRTEIQI